jgi:hypothetical protein
MDLKEIGCRNLNWTELLHGKSLMVEFVVTVTNLRVLRHMFQLLNLVEFNYNLSHFIFYRNGFLLFPFHLRSEER